MPQAGPVDKGAKKTTQPPQVGDLNTAPNTTAADDLRTAGQRWTNRLWESVQAVISIFVVATALAVNARLAMLVAGGTASEHQIASANSGAQNINVLASLIVGFYFGRVNHQKEAGVQKGDLGR